MSRTTLSVLTAGVLAVLSLGTMLVRYQVLGEEVRRPRLSRVELTLHQLELRPVLGQPLWQARRDRGPIP